MTDSHAPLVDFAELEGRVLCVAVHAGDAIVGCGSALARHVKLEQDVRVLIVTAGAEEEARAAGAELGLEDYVCLGLPRGEQDSSETLAERIAREVLTYEPATVYLPSPFERDRDRVAVGHAAAGAFRHLSAQVLLYGVDQAVVPNARLDATGMRTAVNKAVGHLASLGDTKGLQALVRGRETGAARFVGPSKVKAAIDVVRLPSERLAPFLASASRHFESLDERPRTDARDPEFGLPTATAVISTWNKKDDVRANLEGLYAQTVPFDAIVVVDNASTDGTQEMIAREFPHVRLIVMPHSNYGACETFNIGFASAATTELTAILDDDVVLPPDWLEKTVKRMLEEPSTTAIVSTKIIEPGMPESYKSSPAINRERYMSTFRGCASLARSKALAEAGGYDERLFIYGNERDLTCRLLNLGYRVLQYPEAEAFHKTPFGIKMGKRSLYYHARNAWLGMLKYAPLADLLRMPFLVVGKVLLRSSSKEVAGEISDATGTIGIGRSIKETPGAWWVLVRAAFSVLYNVPYCLKRRQPVRSPDFELPIQ